MSQPAADDAPRADSHAPPCYVHRIGVAVPERSLDPQQAATLLPHGCTSPRAARLLQRVARLTGIERRHLVALDHTSTSPEVDALYRPASVQPNGPGMSARSQVFDLEAGRLVLRSLAEFPPAELSAMQMLVTVSCTHASSPGLERAIFDSTPVPHTVDRWNLGFMGCSAALAALRLAQRAAYARRDSLLVACELSSLHFQYTDALDQMTANVLFADGAASVAVSPRPSPTRVVECAAVSLPAFAEQMVWRAGDHGLALVLSQDLPATLAAHLPHAVAELLRRHGLRPETVDHWLVHPGGPQILDAVEACLNLPSNALAISRSVLRRYGNMSSPTILFILREAIQANLRGNAVAIAFGPGLTVELALLRLGCDPSD